MFKVDNELENANVPRTIRFTESLFERLDEAAGQKITATGRKTAAVIFFVYKSPTAPADGSAAGRASAAAPGRAHDRVPGSSSCPAPCAPSGFAARRGILR